jgi:hypothetical protein
MRFQIFLLSFLAVLAPSLARLSPDQTELTTRSSVDHEDVALFHRGTFDVDERDVDERALNDHDIYPRSTFDPVLARSILQVLVSRHKPYRPKTGNPLTYGKTPAPKKTAAEAKARKETMRQKVAANQHANGVKREAYATAVEAMGDKRAAGSKLPKKPKGEPEANMQKGQAKSEKGAETQKAANERKAQRKQPFRDAGVAYKNTKNLPGRPGNSKTGYKGSKSTYNVPNAAHPTTGKATPPTAYSSKDVRTAVYNAHLFGQNKVNHKPADFQNRKEGPSGNKHKPLLHMTGSGTEFPITKQKGGYQGGNPGSARVIIQKDPGGGSTFKGVVAHNSQLNPTSPGYNDHHEIKPTKPGKQYKP